MALYILPKSSSLYFTPFKISITYFLISFWYFIRCQHMINQFSTSSLFLFPLVTTNPSILILFPTLQCRRSRVSNIILGCCGVIHSYLDGITLYSFADADDLLNYSETGLKTIIVLHQIRELIPHYAQFLFMGWTVFVLISEFPELVQLAVESSKTSFYDCQLKIEIRYHFVQLGCILAPQTFFFSFLFF